MTWWDGITDSMDMNLSKFWELVLDRESLVCWSTCGRRVAHVWATELNWFYNEYSLNEHVLISFFFLLYLSFSLTAFPEVERFKWCKVWFEPIKWIVILSIKKYCLLSEIQFHCTFLSIACYQFYPHGLQPGSSVLHYLPEFAQIHVHWVDDAIQPSHPLSPPSPLALNLFQYQGLFQWVGFSHQVANVLEL